MLGTAVAGFRAATAASPRGIISVTGRKAARPRSRILALLCRRHHRAVHEEGYHVDRDPDGTLQFRLPDGRPLPEVPPPAPVPADPVQVLQTGHVAQGLHLHARTTCAGWLGKRLDVGWAIDVLHPLAAGPSGSLPPAAPWTVEALHPRREDADGVMC